MQAQLQEARTADRVLNHAEATLRRNRRWTGEVGKKCDVIVGRVEIWMVENVEGVSLKA